MHGSSPLPSAQRSLLRFFMGGSVDDGKSTLIGRLLHETDAVAEDELAALKRDSARFSASGQPLDFSLLVDGLEDEREVTFPPQVAPSSLLIPLDTKATPETPPAELRTPT
jgi:bifunctional enzyme CysN/CysC